MRNPTAPAVVLALLTGSLLASACQRKEEPIPAPRSQPPAPPTSAPNAATPPVAASTEAPPSGVLRAYVWDCGGEKLRGRNLWREKAIAIDLHDGTHRLNAVPGASGAKYSDGVVTLFIKGGLATLEAPGRPPAKCSEIRAESVLEDARLRGVLYRGQGNEPGWTLEVGPGRSLVWITRSGEERHEYPDSHSSGDAASGLVYAAAGGSGEITARLVRTACRDDMSGEGFDHQVVVSFGGTDYRGCATRVQP